MLGQRQLSRYAKMTRDGTEQGRAFRLSGRPDLSEMLTSVPLSLNQEPVAASKEWQPLEVIQYNPTQPAIARPDKSELFAPDPIGASQQMEWHSPQEEVEEVVFEYDEPEVVFFPDAESTKTEEVATPVPNPGPSTSAVERVEKLLGNVLDRLSGIEKAMWKSNDFATRLGANMEALNKRMERVEKFMGANRIQVATFFPIKTSEDLDQMRLKAVKDDFKTALGLYFVKMLKEMDKTKDLAKIFRKWFGDLPLTLYHNGKTSGYKSDKCPIIAEMKQAFLAELDIGDTQFKTLWKTEIRRCVGRVAKMERYAKKKEVQETTSLL